MPEGRCTVAAKTKKVILFIADGPTDENAFGPILKKLFQSEEIRFHIVHGDITSDRMLNSANAIRTVKEHIEFELDRYGFKRSDILKVVHLIDTDGAFIPDANVVQGDGTICYGEEQIIAKNPQTIVERNARKTSVLQRLSQTAKIWTIPYAVYYFSRNQEQVMHDISSDLTDEEKIDCADDFANQYREEPNAFISFLSNSDFTVKGDYKESWSFIFEGTNSLHRYCNLHLLFTG